MWDALSGVSAALAALLSFFAIIYQVWSNKKSTTPILIPELKTFSANIHNVIYDWDTNEELDKKFSNSTLELKNIGKESAVDIRYSFRIENEDELQEYFLKSNKPKNTPDARFVKICDDEFLGKIVEFHRISEKEQSYSKTYFANSYVKTGSSIAANSSEKIYLPSYFIAIVNHNFVGELGYEGELKPIMPILRLKINFKDIYLKEWSVVYLLSMSRAYSFKSYSNLTTSVEYEQINKMKRIRSKWVKYIPLLAIVLFYAFLY
ncbi:hypothetical protein HCJ66_01070 [Listeria sp. FSL L7-1582]|uniref:hypothetical protein n=1 Tax=Listeria portnoyi TaxID=2713504 RepID=UPI00164E363F|nr:hypothetical protein [Listeria portnoyi]MBC6308133.1 hypothetical protein [Listeria portnoyi]